MEGFGFSVFFGSALMAALVAGIAYAATGDNSIVAWVVGIAAFLVTGWLMLTRA